MNEKKVREAIDELKSLICVRKRTLAALPTSARKDSLYNNEITALETAIEALEKQLPKKLAEHHYEEPGEVPYVKYGCGNGCRIQPARSSKYCNQCGQRIDWSE